MTHAPFRCVVVGDEVLLVECTRQLLARGHDVVAVVTANAELRDWARDQGLEVMPFGVDLAERLASRRFEYLFSIANLRMLPDALLERPTRLPINFHDGPLPKHAGLFATSWAILQGETEHGVTWHVMTREADTGDILKQRTVSVAPRATVHDLDVACLDAGVESFAELIDELASGTATHTPQALSRRTYHGRFDGLPAAGLFDWQRPAADLDAWVRATAFDRRANHFGIPLVTTGREWLAVRAAEPYAEPAGTAVPGEVIARDSDGLVVATGDGRIRLTSLADLTGKPVEPATVADYLAREHGGRFPLPDATELERLVAWSRAAHREEARWARALQALSPLQPPRLGALGEVESRAAPVALPDTLSTLADTPASVAVACVLAFLARLCPEGERDLAWVRDNHRDNGLFASELPLRIPGDILQRTLSPLAAQVAADVDALRSKPPYRRDLLLRDPSLTGAARFGLPMGIELEDTVRYASGRPLTVRIDARGTVAFHAGDALPRDHEDWLAARFALFVDGIAANPGQRLADVALISEPERARILAWNDTAEPYPRERTVTQLIAEAAGTAPATPALRFEGTQLDYAELDQAANRVAHRLIDAGAGPGERVGVYLTRSPALIIGLLAVMKSGAAYVPLDPIYPPERLRMMLEDSGSRWVLTNADAGDPFGELSVTRLPVDSEPADAASASPVDRSRPDAPAYVIYTSGSTGRPKGVQVGHRALVNFLWTMARKPGFSAGDSLLALTTVCFDIAGLELYLPLVRGGLVEILPAEVSADGVALRQRVERARPTLLQATPTTWRMLIAAGWEGDPGLHALCGGEALPDELAGQLAARVGKLFNVYGPTETTIWSTLDEVNAGEPVTIGHPIGNTRCHLLDARGAAVPPGIPGELYIAGDGVADGYLGHPELTAERFVHLPPTGERAYRTGDLVRQRPDGRLQFLERLDRQIKLNGYRIELAEIESVLRRMDTVSEAVALVREDRPGEQRLVAYVTGNDALPPAEALRSRLADSLPGYMVPTAVVVLPRMPLTANGKIDRKALPKPAPKRVAGASAATRNDLERRIAGVWCEVLGLEDVGAEDNFFDLGGDSLRLTSVTALLRERLGRPVTRLDMFGHPTVRAMAAYLGGDSETGTRPPRRRRDVATLSRRRKRTQTGSVP